MTTAREYTVRLSDLLCREHEALAEFLVELSAFDRLGLWREYGYATLFDFLHRELGLSRGAAHYRKVGADLVRRFPEIVEPLRDGRLCFSSVVELSKVITAENRAEVLPRFFHRSKSEAKAVAAEIKPAEAAPHRDVVTAVRRTASPVLVPTAPALPVAAALHPCNGAVHPDELARQRTGGVHPDELSLPPPGATPTGAVRGADRPDVEPLTADLARLHVTVPKRLLDKLDRARDALSHSSPGASIAEIIEAGLDLVLDRAAKRRGLVAKPQKKRRPAKPDRVRASVVREVWKRDGGRCQYRLPNGEICGSTVGLELHHKDPRARGGGHTAEDLVLQCKPHHRVVTRQDFGDDWIDGCIRRRRERGIRARPLDEGEHRSPAPAVAGPT
jgi:hypothetical protein